MVLTAALPDGGRPEARCLLLHGFAGSPESWGAVRRRLPPGWRVVAPALAGHDPAAPWPTGVERFDDEVDRLAELSESPGGDGDGALLCGYSLGGRLALGLLARHPDRWRGALVIGVHPGLAEDDPARAERIAADERWARRIEDDLGAFVDEWTRLPLFASQSRVAPEALAVQDRIRRHHRPEALARAMRVLSLGAMPARLPALARNRVSLVAMAGALDEKFRGLALQMAGAIPRTSAAIVPAAGHNLPLEAPEAVAVALMELAGGGR